MIKINLLSASAGAAPAKVAGLEESAVFLDPQKIKAEAIKRTVIVVLFPIGLYLYEYYNIPMLEKEVQTLQSTIAEKEAYNKDKQIAVAQIKTFQDSEKDFQNRISILESLSKQRMKDVDVINMIKTSLSEEALRNTWLDSIDLRDAVLTITGYSFDDTEITVFIDKLQKSIFFSRVVFDGANEKEMRGRSLKEFKITCDLEKEK